MPRYGAIDIGSNSVRMQAAEALPGPDGKTSIRILVSNRQVTRLGESVFRSGFIGKEAIESTCEVLSQMAAAYRKLDVAGVRAVATSAVRDAQNQWEFLQAASQALGAPVEIISGKEEARLIHLGVQRRWPHPGKRLLILDIGGGSAEMILSEHGRLAEAFSKPLGAVRLTEVFFKSDPPSPEELHRLETYIQEKIAPAVEQIGRVDRGIATSATAATVVCAVHHLPRSRRDEADQRRVKVAEAKGFYQDIREQNLAERRKIPWIGPRRAEIIIAGAAVLLRVIERFHLPALYYSAAGVRDGIIADLAARGVGRELSQLSREQRRAVEEMARQFRVPIQHGRKVADIAHSLFERLQPLHRLASAYGRLLQAAAYLHDVGHSISSTGHHKHSYYIVANSDLPGFTQRERLIIANLCRYHRKSPPKPAHENFKLLDDDEKRAVTLLMPLLRLADNLDRTHEQRVEQVECYVRANDVTLRIVSGRDIDLEEWAAAGVEDLFRDVYDRGLTVQKRP